MGVQFFKEENKHVAKVKESQDHSQDQSRSYIVKVIGKLIVIAIVIHTHSLVKIINSLLNWRSAHVRLFLHGRSRLGA